MKVKRAVRVAELLKREISEIISFKVRDPFVKSIFITHVKLSDDLKYAKIYYRTLEKPVENEDKAMTLERVSKFIRMEVGCRTELRFIPELNFVYDEGIDQATRIDYLLEKIKKNQPE